MQLAEIASTHYLRSLELDAAIPETHARYGVLLSSDGWSAAKGVAQLLEPATARGCRTP